MQDAINIPVQRGEDLDAPDNNDTLGELEMAVTPPSQGPVPVAAVFELDNDGIIHFTAVTLSTSSRTTRSIIEIIERTDGKLDGPTIARIEEMVANKEARSKTVQVKSK